MSWPSAPAADALCSKLSPDGKYLYHFGEKVLILSTDDFKAVDRMDLAKPDLPGMEDIGFGANWIASVSRECTFRFSIPPIRSSTITCSGSEGSI